jgi:hypothetical protein
MSKDLDIVTYRMLQAADDNWRFYIEAKKALIGLANIDKLDDLKMNGLKNVHPLSIMMLTDLAKTLEHYMPRLRDLIGNYNQEDRKPDYNRVYLESFWYGHIVDEMNGVKPDLSETINKREFIGEIDVYDVGGGLCYWSDLVREQVPGTYNMHVVDKPEMLDIISTQLAEKYPHMNGYQLLNPSWMGDPHLGYNNIIIMAQFLHLFTLEEAVGIVIPIVKEAINLGKIGAKTLFLFIEPTINMNGNTPMFSFNMIEQMKVMKGIKSCWDIILPYLVQLLKDKKEEGNLEKLIDTVGQLTLVPCTYSVLPIYIGKGYTPCNHLEAMLERRAYAH